MDLYNYRILQRRSETPHDFLTIRVRVASDLDNLRKEFMPQLSPTIKGGGTDYPFRATISHKDFGAGLAKIGEAIKYPNFKNAVGDQMGSRREHAYHKVWHALFDLQSAERD